MDYVTNSSEQSNLIYDAEDRCIYAKNGRSKIRVELDEISYFESDKRRVLIHTDEECYQYYGKLSELEEILPKDFVRTHQSYVVNMRKVREFGSKEYVLKNGSHVLISRGYLKKRNLAEGGVRKEDK